MSDEAHEEYPGEASHRLALQKLSLQPGDVCLAQTPEGLDPTSLLAVGRGLRGLLERMGLSEDVWVIVLPHGFSFKHLKRDELLRLKETLDRVLA